MTFLVENVQILAAHQHTAMFLNVFTKTLWLEPVYLLLVWGLFFKTIEQMSTIEQNRVNEQIITIEDNRRRANEGQNWWQMSPVVALSYFGFPYSLDHLEFQYYFKNWGLTRSWIKWAEEVMDQNTANIATGGSNRLPICMQCMALQ